MYEHLLKTLPEGALACRALYEPETGGYHLPPRADNRPLTRRDVADCRKRHPQVQFDCIEAPVADLLYAIVVNTRSRLVLETGTSRGFSTSHLAAALSFGGAADGHVFTVDPAPTPHPFFVGSEVAALITPLPVDALALDLQPLLGTAQFDFMFFDSLHTYAHLSRELAQHLPRLKVGGLFALHDSFVYDDLGLVVLAMMAWPQVEAVSLPTHRRHAPERRSPGVSLFRKVAPIAPGELLFPDLGGVVEGERQCLVEPGRVVARTGGLFTDRRYAASRLHLDGPRLLSSPALLEPAEAPPAAPPQRLAPADIGAFVQSLRQSGDAPPRRPTAPLRLQRLPQATPEQRRAEAEWWRVHADLEALGADARWRTRSHQRWSQRLHDLLADRRSVGHIRHGTAATDALAAGRDLLALDVSDAQAALRLRPAEAYVFDRALFHLPAQDAEAWLHAVHEQAPGGALVVLIEPVCFPDHAPDDKDTALTGAMNDLVAQAADALSPAALGDAQPRVRHVRERLERRWWGELPRGPSPLQQPFVNDEPARLLAARFALRSHQVVQSLREAFGLSIELSLLADHQPEAARRLAGELLPRLDALETALLRFARLPDTSWYLSMTVADVAQ